MEVKVQSGQYLHIACCTIKPHKCVCAGYCLWLYFCQMSEILLAIIHHLNERWNEHTLLEAGKKETMATVYDDLSSILETIDMNLNVKDRIHLD